MLNNSESHKMTPVTLLQMVFKHLPKHIALYFTILLLGNYVIIDHFIYDLTPKIVNLCLDQSKQNNLLLEEILKVIKEKA